MSNESANELLLAAKKVGIKFNKNQKRDDIKSLSMEYLLRKSKENDDFWALRDIDFNGYSGEVIGIIGSNGAGKTTLCRVITEILKPDEGKVTVKGKISALLSMGTGFNAQMSGRENIFLNGMMLGMSKREVNVFYNKIVSFSGLEKFIDLPIRQYSTGMRSRLAFSIAAMLEPEILVLDEALNPGDMAFKKRATDKIREIVQKARVVIIVSHNTQLILKNCTKAIWIDAGQLKIQGLPKKVVTAYRHSVPINKNKKVLNLKETKIVKTDQLMVKVDQAGIKFKHNGKEFWPLRDITFNAYEGEIIGIIGHNGAGKSTLCRILTNIYRPDEGSAEVYGKTTALLSFGTGFNRQLNAYDNISLNGMMLGLSKVQINQVQDQIISFAGLEKHADKPLKNYSSGMKARLGFSIAAVLEPSIFIIDEALSTGDIEFQEKASDKIQEMITAAKLVIIVTHSMKFVETVCTRAIWIDKGKILFSGDPKEAVRRYQKHVMPQNGMIDM